MKTITMDFDTYKQEIQTATERGAKLRPELIQAVYKIQKACGSYDRSQIETAIREFYKVVDSMREDQ